MSTTITIVKNEIEIKIGCEYNVIFFSDSTTPPEFIIGILIDFFDKTESTAAKLAKSIRDTGSEIVGQYIYGIATEKQIDTIKVARTSGYPMRVTIQRA